MKIREIVRLVEFDGWIMIGQEGSHRQYKHPAKRGKVTIAGHPGKDVSEAMISSILRQAGLTRKDLR